MDGMKKKQDTAKGEAETVPVVATVTESIFYTVGTYLMLHQQLPVPAGVDAAQIIFWMGQLGYTLHTHLMENAKAATPMVSTSRSSPVVPESAGMLFKYLAAPHIMFEMLSWVGLAKAAKDNQSTTVQCGLVVAVLAFQAKRFKNRMDDDGAGFGSIGSRSSSGGAKPKAKRWALIPYVY